MDEKSAWRSVLQMISFVGSRELMKKIVALVDLTEISKRIIAFALKVTSSGGEIHVVHISGHADESNESEAKRSLDALITIFNSPEATLIAHTVKGAFHDEVVSVVERLQPDLVLVGTHGKKGMRQSFFGSNILHLVKELPVHTLVIQEHSALPENGFRNVLVPASSHQQWDGFVEGMLSLAGKTASYKLYAIYKGPELHQQVRNGMRQMRSECARLGINPILIEEEARVYSVGYARQTIEYLKADKNDLLAIWSHTTELHNYFGDIDKESLLLNPDGVPVLCCP